LVIFDTPGIHRPLHRLNKRMLEEATAALDDADLIVLVRDATESFGSGDGTCSSGSSVRSRRSWC
jgi:GTP-binding protein Era